MAQTSVEHVVEDTKVEVVVSGPAEAIRKLDERHPAGVRVVDADTVLGRDRESSPEFSEAQVLWLGWPDPEITGLEWVRDRLWVLVDHADLASLQARRGPEIMEQIARTTHVRGVIALGPDGLDYLSRRAPGRAVSIYGLDAGASLDDAVAQVRAVRRSEDTPTLLLHRPNRFRISSGDPIDRPAAVIHELCEAVEQLDGSPADAVHLLGAPDGQRENGRIRPRNAAWHLASAAQAHGDSVLMTDDLDVAVTLAGYKSLNARLWLILDRDATTRLADPETPDHDDLSRAVRLVVAKGGSVVVCDPRLREMLRDVPDVGRRVLVAGQDGMLDLAQAGDLARAAGRYRPLREECTVLLAGHDFKFAGELVEVLGSIEGARITYDKWEFQHRHSVKQSDQALRGADVILCEFASHNAVWYSWHKLPGQRLVVHFHGYELFQDWVRDINVANVDVFVFVSEFYRDRVIGELGWPREKTAVIPNMVDPSDLDRPKTEDARFHLAVVGIVPILKRPDRGLDLLERLLQDDDRYVLHIRGRNPWEYQWMWRDPVVRDAYEGFYERLAENPRLLLHVSFDAFGADMGRWFRRIGWTLSPSYRETFHLAPVEGMVGGAVPIVWDRAGAAEIFGARWVHGSTEDAARFILRANSTPERYRKDSEAARRAAHRYSVDRVGPLWADVLFDDARAVPELEARFERSELERRYLDNPTAAALDRLALYLLKREHDVAAVERLFTSHPKQALSASQETKALLTEMRTRALYATGEFVRPDRCQGVLYQARSGSAIAAEVVESSSPGQSHEEPISLRVELVGDGEAREMCRLAVSVPAADRVQIFADALVRAARRSRPSALATRARPDVAWATVVAARRLGVPAVLVDDGGEEPVLPPRHEFDAVVSEVADVTPEIVTGAVRRHADLVSEGGLQRGLHDLTVGIIADEFTSRTVSGRCRTVPIHRANAYVQVATAQLDVLFVESAWTGQDREWFHGVAYYENEREDIERAVEVARAMDVPVLFWNKEDPVHFKSFAPTASLCDAVFTTDAGRLPAYLKNAHDGRPSVAASLPFYAEPRLHHPMPGTWTQKRTISYAGTYYGSRFADRSAELDGILTRAAAHGLTIYDRQKNIPDSPYSFPERYEDLIEGGLSYDEVLEAYKAHPVHINVNSVHDSPTMFSRRVVEIAASGAVVISGRGRGLAETLPEIPASADADLLDEIMAACMTGPDAWARLAWDELRAVRRAHRADQALTLMFRSAGLTLSTEPDVPWTARVHRLSTDVAASLTAQTSPAAAVTADEVDEDAVAHLSRHGIDVVPVPTTEWSIEWRSDLPGTWAEDLLYASLFAPEDVAWIGARAYDGEHGILHWATEPSGPVFRREGAEGSQGLVWLLPEGQQDTGTEKEFQHND